MNKKLPDFVGTWGIYKEDGGKMHDGDFSMYIEESVEISDGKYIIKGNITDFFGDASFCGEMSSSSIKFTKIYSKEAVLINSAESVEYEGYGKNGGIYAGKFTVNDGMRSDGKTGNWEGTFSIVAQYQFPNN